LENEQQKPIHIAPKTIKFCSMIEPKFCYEECWDQWTCYTISENILL